MAAQRLLRYAMFIQGFSYDIMYKPTKDHANANALSQSEKSLWMKVPYSILT